jgi:hypothetical protein
MEGISMLRSSFANQIEAVAAQAGLRVQKLDPSLVLVPFLIPGERRQRVWVRDAGVDAAGNRIVRFSSPAVEVPGGQQLGQKMANELLRENAKLAHGAWAVEDVQDKQFLVAVDTRIMEYMDPPEFRASANTVALAADAKEKQLEKDEY